MNTRLVFPVLLFLLAAIAWCQTTGPDSQPSTEPATRRGGLPKIDNWVFTWTIYHDEGITVVLQRKPEGDVFIVSKTFTENILPRDIDAVGLLLTKAKENCARQKELAKTLKSDYPPQRDSHKVGNTTVTFEATKGGSSGVRMGSISLSAAEAETFGDFLKDASKYVTALNARMKIVN